MQYTHLLVVTNRTDKGFDESSVVQLIDQNYLFKTLEPADGRLIVPIVLPLAEEYL